MSVAGLRRRYQTEHVANIIDLDAAAAQIAARRAEWRRRGIFAGETTWRDQAEGWPPVLKIDRRAVVDADSIGVSLRKGTQEGSVVLFGGGWADLLFRDGCSNQAVDEAPGWEDWLDPERFGHLLDRLTGYFT
jgi:hypothetical protein